MQESKTQQSDTPNDSASSSTLKSDAAAPMAAAAKVPPEVVQQATPVAQAEPTVEQRLDSIFGFHEASPQEKENAAKEIEHFKQLMAYRKVEDHAKTLHMYSVDEYAKHLGIEPGGIVAFIYNVDKIGGDPDRAFHYLDTSAASEGGIDPDEYLKRIQ
jgi:hypothetical protein